MRVGEKLRGSIIIKVDVKVNSDDEFMRCGSSVKINREGLEKVEDDGG